MREYPEYEVGYMRQPVAARPLVVQSVSGNQDGLLYTSDYENPWEQSSEDDVESKTAFPVHTDGCVTHLKRKVECSVEYLY